MRKFSRLILFSIVFIFGLTGAVKAQINEPPPVGQAPDENPPRRPNLLQELGLSKDQIKQIRQLNRELQPQMRQAQRNLREANQALDEAIYADELSDSLIQERVKTLQAAQIEMVRNRTMMETSIRKILTREQLIKFRDLRQKFKPKNPEGEMDKPNNRMPNDPNQAPRKRLRQMQKRQAI